MTTGNKPPPRFQFSLRHVFALLLALSVFLALVTQLRHVGLVTACFLGGIAGGWWFRLPRLIPASMTALCVFVMVYFACWVQFGYTSVMNSGYDVLSQASLEVIGDLIKAYAEKNGEFPDSLTDLSKLQTKGSRGQRDLWGNPYHYQKTARGFELASLGRDGRPGGVGYDADQRLGEKPPSVGIPPWEFVFASEGSGVVFNVAWIASLAAGAIWFAAQGREPFHSRWHIVGMVGISIAAVLVAVFLAFFYVVASQSGGGH